jgi:hypothetical protein
MAQNFAGAAFNFTPDQIQKVFGPGGVTFDMTNRFDPGSLGVPSTKSNRSFAGLTQLKQSGIDPNSFAAFEYMRQYGTPTTAEELAGLVPLYEKLDKSRAETANKMAERKFGQELFAAGIGALGRGVKIGAAGGDPAILGALAQAPLEGARLLQMGMQTPFTSGQPMSPQQHQQTRYFS